MDICRNVTFRAQFFHIGSSFDETSNLRDPRAFLSHLETEERHDPLAFTWSPPAARFAPTGDMCARSALVVEDEILTALHIEDQLAEMGVRSIGIATDRSEAMDLARDCPDVAFVDLNLRDGPTGTVIAEYLAAHGVRVYYITANPAQLGEGRRHAVGVIEKPCNIADLRSAVSILD